MVYYVQCLLPRTPNQVQYTSFHGILVFFGIMTLSMFRRQRPPPNDWEKVAVWTTTNIRDSRIIWNRSDGGGGRRAISWRFVDSLSTVIYVDIFYWSFFVDDLTANRSPSARSRISDSLTTAYISVHSRLHKLAQPDCQRNQIEKWPFSLVAIWFLTFYL